MSSFGTLKVLVGTTIHKIFETNSLVFIWNKAEKIQFPFCSIFLGNI